MIRLFGFSLLVASGLFAGADTAHAYLDPGTGSLILQSVIGAVAAGAAMAGIYWQKVKTFFSGKRDGTTSDEDAGEDSR